MPATFKSGPEGVTILGMVSPTLLNELRCLHTSARLRLVDDGMCDQINQLIDQRRVFDVLGRCLTRPVDGMLVNEAFSYGYPIHDEVVHLLRDEAIVLNDLDSSETHGDATND